MNNTLQQPFSDIIGNSSPVQKTVRLLWKLADEAPYTISGTDQSKSCASLVLVHLLGLMESTGLINCRGFHSSSMALLRTIEDATDCLAAVGASQEMAEKWQNGKLKASEAAKYWTQGKIINENDSMADYRKMIRNGLNAYSHCTPEQTNWNIYLESIGDNKCTMKLNTKTMVINLNGYYIDRYLCIHNHELISVIFTIYEGYFEENLKMKMELLKQREDVNKIIIDFLEYIGEEVLDISIAPELKRLRQNTKN